VKNEHDALEIYQNTVYKAYINIHKIKNPQYFKTWITKILINIINDTFRQNKKETEIYNRQTAEEYKEGIDIEDRIVLYAALDSLTYKYKTSIILKYIHDMSIKDISMVMNCSENTVKSYIHRAKKELLKTLKGV
jgi:RNA polymerase sigma-70 factor (ECF subfamily)